MAITKEIIPVFREQKYGTVINVASMGGRFSFPFYSVYHSTKWAVEEFSESLQYELRPFNIKIKIVEPGVIETDFYGRSLEILQDDNTEVYDSYLQSSKKKMGSTKGSKPIVVAETIFKAANDESWRLRYTAGSDARLLLLVRKLAPDQLLFFILRGRAFLIRRPALNVAVVGKSNPSAVYPKRAGNSLIKLGSWCDRRASNLWFEFCSATLF